MTDIKEMQKAQFERAYAKAQKRCSDICAKLIAAGYGNERGSETRARAASTGDALAMEYAAANDIMNTFNEEREARLRWHGTLHSIYRQKTWHLGKRNSR